jgi:lysophospholipase L1-like esterase
MRRKAGERVGTFGRWVAIGALTALSMVLATPPLQQAASAAPPRYHEYVALGDSYTADVLTSFPPTTQFVPIGCGQSATDYPHQLAKLLHVAVFRDVSCGGATTSDMTKSQGVTPGGPNAPQFDALTPTTDLVTIGIGGNDVGLVGQAESCLNVLPDPVPGLPEGLGGSCRAAFTAGGVDQIDQDIKNTAPKIATVLAEIHQRSPHARILLVNYLDAVPTNGQGCWPVVPVQNADMAYLSAKFVDMNNMLGWMATLSHVQVVDTYTPTIGHDVCQAPNVRYVEGLIPFSLNPPGVNFPLHPNGAGAEAQTQAVYAAIENG